MAFLSAIAGWLQRAPRTHEPVCVRRVVLHCPHGGGIAEVDLVIGPESWSEKVLGCSLHGHCPPPCEQACRFLPEAQTAPTLALIMLPPGSQTVDELD